MTRDKLLIAGKRNQDAGFAGAAGVIMDHINLINAGIISNGIGLDSAGRAHITSILVIKKEGKQQKQG